MSADIQSLLRQVRQLTSEERAQLIKYLEDPLLGEQETAHANETNESPNYLALFGSGRGGFATAAEADEFIRQERDSWDN